MPGKYVYNSITLAHKCALLLSPDNIYSIAYHNAQGNPTNKDGSEKERWVGNTFKAVVGLKKDTVRSIALGGFPNGAPNTDYGETIVASLRKFREEMKQKLGTDHRLFQHEEVTAEDFSVEVDLGKDGRNCVGEASVWNVAKKLGLSREESYIAIEKERNMRPKENCSYFLSEELATMTLDRAAGAYLIITPTAYGSSTGIRLLTMRISHVMTNPYGSGCCIRVKVNLPNRHSDKPSMRYQYRGHLIPTNGQLGWSMHLGQAPYTVDLEEEMFQAGKQIIEPRWGEGGEVQRKIKAESDHPIHLADDMHIQLKEPHRARPTIGLLSSLSQRTLHDDVDSVRTPYCSLIVTSGIFLGDFTDEERRFMQEGIGIYRTLEEARTKLLALVQTEEQIHAINDTCDAYEKVRERHGSEMMFKCPSLPSL
ncbi:hypothetical protein NBRC116494_23480 [Aurantivibrio plasticivorans]